MDQIKSSDVIIFVIGHKNANDSHDLLTLRAVLDGWWTGYSAIEYVGGCSREMRRTNGGWFTVRRR